MKEMILATANLHKVEEIRKILKGFSVHTISLGELKNYPKVIENRPTLEGNAEKKARVIARHFKRWALADDSGLEVAYLGGKPGVYSARWAGPGCTYSDNNRKLLKLLRGVQKKNRSAMFRCVIALSDPKGKVVSVEGNIRGIIGDETKGKGGFGYDPLFIVPGYGKTFAELSSSVKNRISHRSRALRKMRAIIEKRLASKE